MKTPDFAAKVWFANGLYWADLGGQGGHTVSFIRGESLLELLRHRTSESKLCESGDLTQWQIDNGRRGTDDLIAKFLAKNKPATKANRRFSPQERKDAAELLKKVGL